jgi:hypothetical protein
MRRSRTTDGAKARWITRAEAAFTLGVSFQEIDRRVAEGSLPHRSVGAVVLVDVAAERPAAGASEPIATSVAVADPDADRPAVRPLRLEPPKVGRPNVRHARLERPTPERPRLDPPRREPPEARVDPVRAPTVAPAQPQPATDIASAPRAVPIPDLGPSPVEGRRGRRSRDRVPMPRGALVVSGVAVVAAVVLGVLQFVIFPSSTGHSPSELAAPASPSPAATSSPIPVGRDPFASPFGTTGTGDHTARVLVRPPAVVREGDRVTAAATVVNEDHRRWLPPSDVTFVARDANGRVIARTTARVSLGPGATQTVIVPDLGVDPSQIAAIEARIHPATLRTGRFPTPDASVTTTHVEPDGKAVSGVLSVGPRSTGSAILACALFDSLDQLAGASTTSVELSKARGGRLRFWMSMQPAVPGPYRASCSV